MDALLTPLGFWHPMALCLCHMDAHLTQLGLWQPMPDTFFTLSCDTDDCHFPLCCCLPHPAWILTPCIRWPLHGGSLYPAQVLWYLTPGYLSTRTLFSSCFSSDTPHQAAASCGFPLLPVWGLISKAGHLLCGAPLLLFLGLIPYVRLPLLLWTPCHIAWTSVSPCWVPSCVDTIPT